MNEQPSLGLIKAFENIVYLAGQHGLNEEFCALAAKHCEAAAQTLKISPAQAALFAIILEHSGSDGATLETIAKAAKYGKIQALQFMDDLDVLEKRHLVLSAEGWEPALMRRRGAAGSRSYTVPLDVIKAIRAGREFRYTAYDNLSPEGFFEIAEELLDFFRRKETCREQMGAEIKALVKASANLAFVKGLKTHSLGFGSGLLLLNFCCAFTQNDDDSLPVKAFRLFLGSRQNEDKFRRGAHKLFYEGLLENGFDCGLADTERYRLTEKAKETFLADLDLRSRAKLTGKDIIRAAAITKRELFYTDKVTRRIGELTALLGEDNFVNINKRLVEQNMRSGFACLFSGPPGTGKTETVYQIARETGRDIYRVDIAESKSMWFGESEKRIKAIFDRYHGMVKAARPAPILLFNEADAILGRRQELGDTRRGADQTENAIQNIILQEMEDLSGGILIATTNMTCNLDKAFERRFLYKIEFEKPDARAKEAIWTTRLPELSKDDAAALSRRYDFSGGQIENIARRQTVSTLLSGRPLSLAEIMLLCEDEPLEKQTAKIGFCA